MTSTLHSPRPTLVGHPPAADDRWTPTALVDLAVLRPGDSPRARGVDLDYAGALAAVRDLPPILVCRRTMRVVDGMHRLTAARLAGRTQIEVRYFDGDPEAAFVQAVKSNLHHGLRLGRQERSDAALRIMAAYPEWSNRAIALASGLSAKTVAALRGRSNGEVPQSNARVGRDGRVRPLDPAAGRAQAAAYLRAHPDASLRQIAAAAGISPGTAADVRARIERGEDPVARRGPQEPVADPWAPDGRAHRRSLARDPIARLARDPSLRFSEPGRQLLRLLDNRALAGAQGAALLAAVPTMSRSTLAAAVRQHVDVWTAFVSALEQTG